MVRIVLQETNDLGDFQVEMEGEAGTEVERLAAERILLAAGVACRVVGGERMPRGCSAADISDLRKAARKARAFAECLAASDVSLEADAAEWGRFAGWFEELAAIREGRG
jgi:hypothetical protein